MNKKNIFGGIMAAFALFSILGVSVAYAAISSQMEQGSTGSDVTELQTYLATNASIYPAGLITGFFGPLTEAAVQRFQTAQGIVSSGTPGTTGYGRVGPRTIAVLNGLLGMGGNTNNQYWDTVPVLTSPSVQYNNNSATFSWMTNEATQGQVYYDSMPLRADEATGPGQLPYVSGNLVRDGGGLTNHQITISNLQSNTTYYYLTRGIDNAGNVSMTLPSSFRTSSN